MYTQLACPGAEKIPLHADNVTIVERLEKFEIALRNGIFLDVDLQALTVLLHVREAGLAHEPLGHHAPRDADARLRAQLFRRLGAMCVEDFRYGVRAIVTAAVGPEPQRLDF